VPNVEKRFATIASLILEGFAASTRPGESFGIVAEQITSVKILGKSTKLKAGPNSPEDTFFLPLSPGVFLHELVNY
jgi:hypothetical protein